MLNNFQNKQESIANRAFLFGDGVWVSFYIKKSKVIFAEESYFYLMVSMRKLRMNIPQMYTLEFFKNLIHNEITNKKISDGVLKFFAYRNNNSNNLAKCDISYYFYIDTVDNVLSLGKDYEIDLIKEITLGTNILSGIHTHHPENIYAEIYAFENDLDDVIILNENKRIARTSQGNILLLSGNEIKIPKQSEGAYTSPLMEAFVTFLDKNQLALIKESEIIAFETQKADEILIISETKGLHAATKIRNKSFFKDKFAELLKDWSESL